MDFTKYTPEQLDSALRFIIGCVFSLTVMGMVLLSLYSLVFVQQPMSGIAPADKNFFYLLNDMSKYILGSLATLLAIKGKDVLSNTLSKPADPEPDVQVTVNTDIDNKDEVNVTNKSINN